MVTFWVFSIIYYSRNLKIGILKMTGAISSTSSSYSKNGLLTSYKERRTNRPSFSMPRLLKNDPECRELIDKIVGASGKALARQETPALKQHITQLPSFKDALKCVCDRIF